MNKQGWQLSYYAFVITFFVFFPLKAATLDELLENEQVSVTIRLQTPGKIITKQAVVLEIEISTQHWFAKGTELSSPQIPNTLILPTNQFAINSTKRIKGITWASQIRELTLYPLKEGTYQIPPIGVLISVNTASSGIIEGELFTPPLSFWVETPTALKHLDNYTISADFKLNITNNFNTEHTYKIGEAVSQKITFSADSVPAMMLPRYLQSELEGVSIYREPVQLQDRKSRGTLTGMRTESFTYIFEQAGEYFIPEQRFYWWNLTTYTLLTELVPSQHWVVNEAEQQGSFLSDENHWSEIKFYSIITLGTLSLFSLFFLTYFKHSNWQSPSKNSISHKRYKKHCMAYTKAIKQKQYQLACTHLYKVYDVKTNQYQTLRHCFNQENHKQKLLEQLLQLAYQHSHNDVIFTLDDAKYLLPNKDTKKCCLKDGIKENIRLNT